MSCWVKHRKSELSVMSLIHNFHTRAWNSKTSTNKPEIYKPAKTAPLQPALLKKQPKAKEGCKWKEMSCCVKHRESELSVMSLICHFHSRAWNSKTSTNKPEIYKPAKTAPLQPALPKKQPKAKEGCKWKEMSCWVKHRESELSVMSLIHDFHSSSTKLLLLHIPKPAGRMICSCNQTWAWPFIIIIKSS